MHIKVDVEKGDFVGFCAICGWAKDAGTKEEIKQATIMHTNETGHITIAGIQYIYKDPKR